MTTSSPPKLVTPVYLKTDPDFTWPRTEKAFYLLTRDGLFFCRNHPFFISSAPAKGWPCELAEHQAFLKLSYPKITQHLLETVVGFFSQIGFQFGAEAAVLLAWNPERRQIEAVVPRQCSRVAVSDAGTCHPVDVRYVMPVPPPDWIWMGDIHSHVTAPAFASQTDQTDETHRPGLHVVVGRIDQEPPEFHVEFVVDGTRFPIDDPGHVVAGYRQRRPQSVPAGWHDQVTIRYATRLPTQNAN